MAKLLHYIKEWRELRGLSLREVEQMTGLSFASVSRIERGEQPFGEDTLILLAKAYRVEPWVLLSVNPLRED
jgi:transcriptional regulator with XRE-family HTH domain